MSSVAFEFDRYIGGRLMAEGVTIERASNIVQAATTAARLASKGPHGEIPVLVLRPTPIEPVAVTDEMVERACQAAGKNWDLWGSREGVAKRELMRTALTAALIVQPKQTEVDGNKPLLLNPLHIELLKRGAQGQFIWLRDRADLHTADLHTAGELCRAGFARMSEPSNIPGPPCFPGFEITESGRAALIAALTPPVTP